jgi:hypothetical protein
MEIKVAESWSLAELDEALDVQLAGKYLRDKDAKRGVLLLVHLMKRARGWPDTKRQTLTFEEVVARLEARADLAASFSPTAPQAKVAVINVSMLNPQRKRFATPRAKNKASRKIAKSTNRRRTKSKRKRK